MAADEWIAQIAAGDREAFRAAYEKYGKTIYQRALEQTGNREQAQAVLKNVFRTLFRQLQDSSCDPLLFLLEGLTDLETGALNVSAQNSAAANESAPPAEEPPAAEETPQEEHQSQPQTSSASLFDRAEAEFGSEYAPSALSSEHLNGFAEPSETNAEVQNGEEVIPAEPEPAENKPSGAHRAATAFLVILLVLLVLLTLWFGAGVLMMYSILPKIDLGYSWFNEHLFNLFRF